MNQDVRESNRSHSEITNSTFLNPYTKTADGIIKWGMVKLGYPLQTVELTRE